jgi:hypothetical protein
MCSHCFENNLLTIEGVRFASISKKTPLSKLSFAFVSLALPLLFRPYNSFRSFRPFRSSGHPGNLVIPVIWSSGHSDHPESPVIRTFRTSGHSGHPVIPVISVSPVIWSYWSSGHSCHPVIWSFRSFQSFQGIQNITICTNVEKIY